jgi:hypothetical protein
MRFSIKITKSRSALHSNSPGRIIYENGTHSGEVYHQTVVTERTSAYVVPTATNRRQQIIRASEIDRGNHISHARAPSDHPGMFADACVPDLTGLVVADIRRLENLTVKYRPERLDVDNGHGWGENCTPITGNVVILGDSYGKRAASAVAQGYGSEGSSGEEEQK